MTTNATTTRSRSDSKSATSHGISRTANRIRPLFIAGPKALFTSRISGKCAAVMLMLCSPSLLFCSILTIPALLFQSPQQNAYFYFDKVLNQDPGRWFVLGLAAVCAIFSLVIPATMPKPEQPEVSYY